MKPTFLTIAMTAQLAAFGAFAQTTDSSTSGSAGVGAVSAAYGSDWSTTLGSALIGSDGVTLRTDSEITTQWSTLSDEDQAMIRRDCTALLQKSGGTTNTTTGTTTTTQAAPEAAPTAAPEGSANSTPMISVTDEQMESICAATKDL